MSAAHSKFFQLRTIGVCLAPLQHAPNTKSMFKIQRSINGRLVVFALSGRIKAARLGELQQLLESEADDHRLVLDLKEVKLVDRDVVSFLASCEAKGMKLANCPPYIREWIEQEATQKTVLKVSKAL